MALSAGTVCIDPTTGEVSGSGHARELYDSMPALVGDLDAYVVATADDYATKSTDPPGSQDGRAHRAGLRVAVLAQR